MSALQILFEREWAERLGWTLVHFLWQGVFIAVLYAVARRVLARGWSPNARYVLACAALTAMLAAPLLTWELMRSGSSAADPGVAYRVRSAPLAAATPDVAATGLPASVRATVPGMHSQQFLPWVVMAWFLGAAAFSVRLLGGCVVAARMRSWLVRSAPPEWQVILSKLATRIGLSGPVRLLVSAVVQVPTVVGWLRPVVLVPVGALSGLPSEHLEALLLHELAHIRRHDYLVNLLQSLAEALLFYQPAVWWVSGHMRAERELCCDDLAVSVSGDALTYARALAHLESYRLPGFTAALAASGGSLSHRIARLLSESRPAGGIGPGPTGLAVAILLVAAGCGLLGESGAHAFRTVSIKPNTSDWSEPTQHVMSMSVNASLMLLIQFVYANHDNPMLGHSSPLPASQVVGGPAWINSLRYDIAAKPVGTADPKTEWRMWQTLLADRFKLRLHRETRELPIYNLMVAASGPKMLRAKEASCVSFPPGTTPHYVPGKVDCGYVAGPFMSYNGLRMEGNKVHMSDLTRQLALVLDRPVVDKTGFTREFDLGLSFTPDDALRGLPGFGGPGDPGGTWPPTDPHLPNIFAALEQQLGLRLVWAKGPVEILVVDYAERPVTN